MATPQGDVRLLDGDVARRLLTSRVPARLAYAWTDGTPRVVPIWFHWTGDEMVMASMASAPKVRALRERPDVAVTIDTDGFPHDVLLVRGRTVITEVDGVVPEYAASARRYLGEDGATAFLAGVDQPGTVMARIAIRPAWVGVLDFRTRYPSALGGVTG